MTISTDYPSPPRLLRSRKETRAMLGIGLTKLDSLVNEGKLTRLKIGRRTLITDESIQRYVTESASSRLGVTP